MSGRMPLPKALGARPERARGAQRRALYVKIARRRGSGLPDRGWRRIIWHLKQKCDNVRGHHQRISWRGGLVCGGRVSLALCVGKRNWGERRSEFTKSRCALPCLISAVHSDPAGRVISRDAGGQRTEKNQRPEKHKREPTGHGALHVQRDEVRKSNAHSFGLLNRSASKCEWPKSKSTWVVCAVDVSNCTFARLWLQQVRSSSAGSGLNTFAAPVV